MGFCVKSQTSPAGFCSALRVGLLGLLQDELAAVMELASGARAIVTEIQAILDAPPSNLLDH